MPRPYDGMMSSEPPAESKRQSAATRHAARRGATLITRFAPSPTGLLHLGHAYSALLAHDFARAYGGQFLLRIEDIDSGRSRPEFETAILEDLTWLGIDWDAPPLRQSSRRAAYDVALHRLIADDLIYPCFCTRKDIADASDAPHGPAGAVYPGTCRALEKAERDTRMEDEPFAWRLNADKAVAASEPLAFREQDRDVPVDPALLGDAVIARKDVGTSYHLAVAVDDAHQGVTHVMRGEDLLPSTHVHRILQAALGLPAPRYRHHPLLTDDAGARLAKRTGAQPLATLRKEGVTPARIRAQLALPSPAASR